MTKTNLKQLEECYYRIRNTFQWWEIDRSLTPLGQANISDHSDLADKTSVGRGMGMDRGRGRG
jgi:hypothetical protein